MDAADPDAVVAAEYAEADDLLRRLATLFVDGDLCRVVVVPGNHDVNWSRARDSMKPLAPCPRDMARKAYEASSGIRWDWRNQQPYEITDVTLYDDRCAQFRQFRTDFYADLKPSPLSYGDDIAVFEYLQLGLIVVGFSSWHGNDCFCEVGEIDARMVALSQQVLSRSVAPIAVAVWHHSVTGGPRARDYMDQRVTHKLIDFGFSLGLYGHQHYPGAAPFEIRLPNLTSMTVVGAGSLAVGDAELPMGERRQFNLVDIDPEREQVTIHVRAMSPAGVFAGSHRDDFGGNTFTTLPLLPSPARPPLPSAIKFLDDAMASLAAGDYEASLELVTRVGPSYGQRTRQVKAEALNALGRNEELIALIDPPQTAEETVKLISKLIEVRRFDRASAVLSAGASMVSGGLARDLSQKIETLRMLT